MALKVNGIDITKVIFNGTEQKALKFNDVGFFGKGYNLTKNTSSGVEFSIKRTSSPNQGAALGDIATGRTIYYGDELTISVTASGEYIAPKLYVDTGDGMSVRTSPFRFTVTDNVAFYGTATARGWRTLWSGSKTFTWSNVLDIPGLADCTDVEVTARAVFKDYYYDSSTYERFEGNEYTDSCNRQSIPVTLRGGISGITMDKTGDQLKFTFYDIWEEGKGFYIQEYPISLTITEVRGQ